MEEYDRGAWETLIERCEEVGVDAFEVNFSCPHGMPERKMGMAMGQDCTVLEVSISYEESYSFHSATDVARRWIGGQLACH